MELARRTLAATWRDPRLSLPWLVVAYVAVTCAIPVMSLSWTQHKCWTDSQYLREHTESCRLVDSRLRGGRTRYFIEKVGEMIDANLGALLGLLMLRNVLVLGVMVFVVPRALYIAERRMQRRRLTNERTPVYLKQARESIEVM